MARHRQTRAIEGGPLSEVNQTYRDQPPMSEFGTLRTTSV